MNYVVVEHYPNGETWTHGFHNLETARLNLEAMREVNPARRYVSNFEYGPVPCPTCGAKGMETCIRGRKPSAIWRNGEPFPQGHDSRRTINKEPNK